MSTKARISVRQVMKTHFDEVDGLATIRDALNTMKHVETKMLIVRKRNSDDEIGVLLLSDIAKEVIAKDRSPDRVNVYEIMSKPVISVEPDMDIRYCARLFERFGLSRAPVVEHGKMVGTISFTDMVLKGLCQMHELCES
jgi:predicted transcriptional regulator